MVKNNSMYCVLSEIYLIYMYIKCRSVCACVCVSARARVCVCVLNDIINKKSKLLMT